MPPQQTEIPAGVNVIVDCTKKSSDEKILDLPIGGSVVIGAVEVAGKEEEIELIGKDGLTFHPINTQIHFGGSALGEPFLTSGGIIFTIDVLDNNNSKAILDITAKCPPSQPGNII